MKIQEIYELMDRFEKGNIHHLELSLEETTLVLEKETPIIQQTIPPLNTSPQQMVTMGTSLINNTEKESTAMSSQYTTETSGLSTDSISIKAPFVGTFYRAPSPEEEPYVVEGQPVKKGDVVGIIEAMKLMNEIVAPKDGTIETIVTENGTLVEYDQVLMTLK